MSNPERQPETHPPTDSDPSIAEWPDPREGGNTRSQGDGPFIHEVVPGPQREIDQVLERVIFLLARISREREALANTSMSLEQSLDSFVEQAQQLATGESLPDTREGLRRRRGV